MDKEKAEREGERVGKRKGESDGGGRRDGGGREGREGRREDGLLVVTFGAMAIMLNRSIYMKPSG